MTANLAALEPRAHPEAAGGPETLRLGMPQLALGGLSEGWLLREWAPGEGGRFVESGATSPGGRVPLNTSGGLVSKSHPVGATGLAMTYELVTQLRGEAGERQVRGAEIALQHNAGGAIGLEDAVCSVAVLHRA